MIATRTTSFTAAPGATRAVIRTARRAPATKKMVVRAQADKAEQAAPVVEEAASTRVASQAAAAVAVADTEVYTVFGKLQESINGRAAMLGFLTAVIAERLTHQSVISQLGGRYVNDELVEHALGVSDMSYGFIVVLVSLATFAPLVFNGEKPGSRSFGPFTPTVEMLAGRAAMMGFAGLVLVEIAKGNTALF